MADISIQVDTAPFERTLAAFAASDRRELPEIVNAKLGDWAWEAARRVRYTTAAIIRAVPDSMRGNRKAWWKFVQSAYNAGFVLKGRRKATVAESMKGYVDPATGKWVMRRETISTFKTTGQVKHRKNDLRRVANTIIRRRAATVKSFVAQFLWTAMLLGKNVATVGGKNSWKFRGILAQKALPLDVKASAAFTIPFRARTLENKKHEGGRQGREMGKINIALRAIMAARDTVVADMQRKLQERYERAAQRAMRGA